MIAERWSLDRTALDEFALASHEKAAAAQDSGAFDGEIAGITDPSGNVALKDEGIRRSTTLEQMQACERSSRTMESSMRATHPRSPTGMARGGRFVHR